MIWGYHTLSQVRFQGSSLCLSPLLLHGTIILWKVSGSCRKVFHICCKVSLLLLLQHAHPPDTVATSPACGSDFKGIGHWYCWEGFINLLVQVLPLMNKTRLPKCPV